MKKGLKIVLACIICFLSVRTSHAGITGSIAGVIRDRDTGTLLAGAYVLVEGTTSGTQANRDGYYRIHRLPAGTYDVTVRMIGYQKVTKQAVQVHVDVTTNVDFDISIEAVPMREVVVTQKRELIQREITSSAYFVSGTEINDQLPIDSYQDAMALLPGVVGNHFRGGRETDVLYMLDGLPIQGGLSREISSYFPNSSIVEMMVQTGGFTAEYGQASSGIVNVVTKDGGNEVAGEIKIFSDFIGTGVTGNDNTRRIDANVGGPMTIGLGGPLISAHYFLSADLNLSDTAHGDKLREAFDSPIFANLNLNSKLSFEIGSNTRLSLQGLLSNWRWRKYDAQWHLNVAGLAKNNHNSHRLSASLTHTFSPRLYASLQVARYSYNRSVSGLTEDPPNLAMADDTNPNSLIVRGSQPWQENTDEDVKLVKFDLEGQVHAYHLLRTGFDFQESELRSQSVRFTLLPAFGTASSVTLNKSAQDYHYTPRFLAFYIQDKIDYNGMTANAGLRYDIFSPQVNINEFPQEFQEFRSLLRAPPTGTNTRNHASISPRLGVSIPLSDKEGLHVNYGWYYQMPPLYYLYTNAEHALTGYLPFAGNLDLEPIKTISSEFSYKRIVANDLLFVFSGFTKQFTNLIDSRTFILPDSVITPETAAVGFAEYTNSSRGKASGFEVTLQKRFTSDFSGRVSYTFMKARGTSSGAEDNHKLAIEGAPPVEDKEFPLSWDQRHSFILDVDYDGPKIHLNAMYRLFSPLPTTTRGSLIPNDARLSWRNILDVKITFKQYGALGGKLKPFLEIRNMFDEENVINVQDDTGVRAYRLFDPINSNFGRRLRVGMTIDF